MTTVAYRDGVLAFDEQITWGGTKWAKAIKARQIGDMIVACSGCSSICHSYLEWVSQNPSKVLDLAPVQDWKQGAERDFDALIITRDSIYSHDGTGRPYPVDAPFLAIGSGMQFALGAMAMGADAVQAVQAAATLDSSTGGAVRTLQMEAACPSK